MKVCPGAPAGCPGAPAGSPAAPDASDAVRAGARELGGARPVWRLWNRLSSERAAIESQPFSGALRERLTKVYQRGLAQTEQRLERALEFSSRALAEELLQAEEGVGLILHELSVELLRDRRRPGGLGAAQVPALVFEEGQIRYRFVGEFWTDELDDLVVAIEDRCLP